MASSSSSSRTWMCSACGVVVTPRQIGHGGDLCCPYCEGPVALVLGNAGGGSALPGTRSMPSPQPSKHGVSPSKSAPRRPSTPQDALSGLGRIVPSSPWVPDAADPPASSEAIGDHTFERRSREAERRARVPTAHAAAAAAAGEATPPPPSTASEPASPREPRRRSNRGPLPWWRSPWTLTAAGGIVIAAIVIYLIDGNNGDNSISGSVPANPPAHADPSNASPAASTPAPQPPAVARRVNLLDRIHVERDTVAGNWELHPEGLMCDAATPAKLKIPYQPPAEYDFVIEFERMSGDDCVLQAFTNNGHACGWMMSGWHGKTGGFHYVNQLPANHSDNPGAAPQAVLDPKHRHTSIVKVRKDHLEAWLDGKLVKRYDTDGSDLSADGLWDVKGEPLGLGTYASATIFYKVEVVEMGTGG